MPKACQSCYLPVIKFLFCHEWHLWQRAIVGRADNVSLAHARTSDVLPSLLHLSALIAHKLMIINISKSVDNLLFCLHCVCTLCTFCLHYLHTACTLCTTCTTYLHCHSVMSVTGIRFFGRSDRFVYLPQLFVLRNTTCTARFRHKKCRACRRCAIKVQAVQVKCR